MKKHLILPVLILLVSCKSEEEKLTSIFNESKITIEMNTCGCFGCNESDLIFYTEATKDDLVTVKGSALNEARKITKEELEEIKDLFLRHLESTSELSGCTSSTDFKIKGEYTEVDLFENDCTLRYSIFSILK